LGQAFSGSTILDLVASFLVALIENYIVTLMDNGKKIK